MYALTQAGEAMLDVWLELFGRYQQVLHSALNSLDNLNRPAAGRSEAPDSPDQPAEEE
jgi:DNA-binding PadR family transcriptional regulator